MKISTNVMDTVKCNIGFDNRTFLTKSEWESYLRRMPVRYIKKKKSGLCEICNKPEKSDNKFENAHIIGFRFGITHLGLTPEYVNSHDNIITAHKNTCNSKAELDLLSSCEKLKNKGVKSIPTYLPKFVRDAWDIA